MTMTLFLPVIIFSHLVNTGAKVFLLETVTSQSVRDTIGEDYANHNAVDALGRWDSMAKCQKICPGRGGYCIDTGEHNKTPTYTNKPHNAA